MKTLREIKNEVANNYQYDNREQILTDYRKGNVSWDFINDYLYDCFIEIQLQQGINDNNLIR